MPESVTNQTKIKRISVAEVSSSGELPEIVLSTPQPAQSEIFGLIFIVDILIESEQYNLTCKLDPQNQ